MCDQDIGDDRQADKIQEGDDEIQRDANSGEKDMIADSAVQKQLGGLAAQLSQRRYVSVCEA